MQAASVLSSMPLFSSLAMAGQPKPEQLDFQTPGTEIGRIGVHMHDYLLMPIITAITLFVLALLIYTVVRFRKSANPVPSKTTHNVLIEVIWTVVPVLILVVIAFPSLRLLYAQKKLPDNPAAVIKVTGHQWYWSYEYIDEKISFDANMLKDSELKPGQPRLLETDNAMVVPAGKPVKLLIRAEDVIHAWWVPSLFVQMDAVPGRTNETWIKVEKPGTYYGQCNQLCGINHGYMPIEVRALAPAEYAAWVKDAQTRFAMNGSGPALADASSVMSPAIARN